MSKYSKSLKKTKKEMSHLDIFSITMHLNLYLPLYHTNMKKTTCSTGWNDPYNYIVKYF